MVGLGQIGLVKSTGFTSWLIRAITRSDYNHCVVYTGNGEVVSAESSGVQVLPVEYFEGAAWSDFDLDVWQQVAIINFSRQQLGKKYGYLTYFWIGFVLLFHIRNTPDWLYRRLNNHATWVCSQLCDSAYQAAGIHLFKDDRATGACFPGSFEPIWKEQGWI
jgi:hypothetical protein